MALLYIAILLILVLPLLLLFSRMHVQLVAYVEASSGSVELTIWGLWKLLHLNYLFRVNILDQPVLSLIWNKKNGALEMVLNPQSFFLKKEKRPKWGNAFIKAIADHVLVDRFAVQGKIGVEEDAFASVMLCGALGELIRNIAMWYFRNQPKIDLDVLFVPEFSKRYFRVNLEGIASIIPAQIILAAWKRHRIAEKEAK